MDWEFIQFFGSLLVQLQLPMSSPFHCYTAVTFDVDDKRLPIKVIIISQYLQSFSEAHNLHWFMSNKFTCSPYVLFTLPSTSGTRFSALSYSLKLFKPIQSPKAITIARENIKLNSFVNCKIEPSPEPKFFIETEVTKYCTIYLSRLHRIG